MAAERGRGRRDHAQTAFGERTPYVILATIIAGLSVTGALSPAAVLAVAAVAGIVRPCEFAVRTVLTSEIVPQDRLMSAISLSRITTDSARAAGALAGAGAVAMLGMTAAYAIVVTLYVVCVVLVLRIPGREKPERKDGQGTTTTRFHHRPSVARDEGSP